MDDDFNESGAFENDDIIDFGGTDDTQVSGSATLNSRAVAIPPVPQVAELPPDVPIPVVTLHNIVASVNLKCEIDLRLLNMSARNCEYNPKKANNVVMRLVKPKCTGLVFQCGSIILSGARTFDSAKVGAKLMTKIIQRVGHPNAKFANFKIKTFIATADCEFPIRLEVFYKAHSDYCSYEPEVFSGVVFRYQPAGGFKAVVLIFVSGKMIITGCKSPQQVAEVMKNMFAILYPYSNSLLSENNTAVDNETRSAEVENVVS